MSSPRRSRASFDLSQARIVLTRRKLLLSSLPALFFAWLAQACGLGGRKRSPVARRSTPAAAPALTAPGIEIVLRVNDTRHTLRVEPRVSLLDALRERLGLTGTKKGCDHGQCGACTVLIAGRPVNACLTLAVMAQGVDITTIEGLAQGQHLHPVQEAFAHEDALQCGYCTPGQIISAVALVRENRARTDDEVREAMSGNLCRCGAYSNIVAAIARARARSA